MGSALSILNHLPPWEHLIHPTPETYTLFLNIFQYFPVVSVLQWLTSYHPAGKTSLKSSSLNLPGRWTWCIMEIVSPLTLLYLLYTLPQIYPLSTFSTTIPTSNKFLAFLFTLHYTNRAIISPFLAAPSISPIHVFIASSAVAFNWFNGVCLAGWLAGYPLPVPASSYTSGGSTLGRTLLAPLGLTLFLGGMAGNISAERTLFKLRREEAHRKNQNLKKDDDTKNGDKKKGEGNIYSKIYTIPPPTGLFTSILYPHYVAEWIEWLGFAILAAGIITTPSPAAAASSLGGGAGGDGSFHLAPWLVPAARISNWLGVPMPLPAVVFLVNAVSNMLPHARWGRRWYVEKFGEGRVNGRGAVVPFFRWL
ncbi:hypothetical protein AbraIFM66951_009413 [Aspergillus brasiliensis]|uniref:Steroid 5-alpha reductase C-terminal domain-containing protein n=1 Tax=Aspergillus brasiliensis TaxID=319629 RepID=A0A9W6DMB0_9EURO|nr:hypothetical protein AbraCBS73388_007746 [Aspergillus brasiliensis]GKZ46471.1 hypothetical protein AbraIFM66951_009413 [Aspergillus brasiliensis]